MEVVTEELRQMALLKGACEVPPVGTLVKDLAFQDLCWCEDNLPLRKSLPLWCYGEGSGNGDRYGSGYGYGDRYGYVDGDGSGGGSYGDRYGYGYGEYGSGDGDGSGDGSGYGYGGGEGYADG